MKHKCSGLVATCIDFRIQKYTDEWIKNSFGVGNHDRVSLGGGVKNIEVVMEQIRISKKLHGIEKVVLINHEDCGAYGEDGNKERHLNDLDKAREMILSEFADLEVSSYFLLLDGTFTSSIEPFM